MHAPRGANALLTILLLLLVLGLAVLATLQYRWIDQVSDAERQRMHTNIDFAARRFAGEISGELEKVFRAFGPPEAVDLPARLEQWKESATDPSLVAAVYVAEREADGWRLRDSASGADVPWPGELDEIRRRLEQSAGPGPPDRFPPPVFAKIPALVIIRREPPPRPRDEPRDESPPDFDRQPPGGPGFGERRGPREPMRAVIVRLDAATWTNVLLPRLTRRHFSTGVAGEYDVALLAGSDVLFRTNEAWPDGRTQPDADLPFVPAGPPGEQDRRPPFRDPARPRMDPRNEPRNEPWHLLVRRHQSLDAVVTAARRRNLAVSFGILLVLGATVALLLVLLRRADRLRAQQTEFVAAISHELNTPVAALRSAGENLRDGIITDPEKLVRYGGTIVKEATRLGDILGQVMEFAGMQARQGRAPAEPVDVAAVVEEAVAQCHWLVADTPIRIETAIEPSLPAVAGDAGALTRAVQNLVANAIRHGGAGNWVGVGAKREGEGIAITVEDRGPGIAASDAAHLFEAFYRGRNSAAVRGAGLGLTIVQQVARAHGGSVRIDRKRRGGAAFTIHLPVTHG